MGQSCCSSEKGDDADTTIRPERRIPGDSSSDDSDYSDSHLNTEDSQEIEKTPEPIHSAKAQEKARKGFIDAIKNGNDSLAMHFVQEYPDLDLLLLIFEADKKNKVQSGDNCLQVAVRNKHHKLILYLLDAGVSPNSQNRNNGETALHTAVRTREVHVVALLSKYNADQNITNNNRETPLTIASDNKDEDILELLAPDTQKMIKKASRGALDISRDVDDVLDGIMDDVKSNDNAPNEQGDTVGALGAIDERSMMDKLDDKEKLKMESMRVARTNPFSKLQRTNTKKALKEMQDIAAAKDDLPEMAAWLEKKQSTMPYQWQKRWVIVAGMCGFVWICLGLCRQRVLIGSYILWSDIQRKIKDTKNIKERKKFNNSVNIMSIAEVNPVKKGKTQRKWVIVVGTGKKKREYVWKCATQSDRDHWVNGLQKHIAHMKSVIVYLGTK
eukprot:73593_1